MRDWKASQVGLSRPREEPRPESAQTLPPPLPSPSPPVDLLAHRATTTHS